LRRLAAIGAANVRCCLRHDLIDPKIALHEGRTLLPAGAVEPTPIAAG
jgi:hypothetical protein